LTLENSKSTPLIQAPEGYSDWLAELKVKIHNAQQHATLAVNHELILLYWQIGRDILNRQAEQGWGAKVIERLAHDLRNLFPNMKGFSSRNLKYMRSFAGTWTDLAIVQQAVAQLPWGHNLVLLDKLSTQEARIWYAKKTIENNWSRKDPYRFDFLGLTEEAQEREIEGALVKQVTEFLLELGAGFAYVGKQVHIEVGGDDFFIDLLFYHLKLRCYIVIELKTGDFKPEHLGQLGFYLTAVDKQIKNDHDSATIGLLLCKNKNKIVAEYALSDKTQPMGIAEFKLLESLPVSLQTQLPSIEDIERELEEKQNGL
jgi:predicted nuclease of restriction endonuclease-like (RecB) superfamily